MNQPMQGDSRQNNIPPTRMHVEAGFVVYTPKVSDDETRSMYILDDGELTVQEKTDPAAPKVKMQPGDIVGVASLLEGTPLNYEVIATRDSCITVIDEECMESELTHLPLWLLAAIRALAGRTRALKQSIRQTRVHNTIKSLALFLSKKPAKVNMNMAQLIQEFSWLTRITRAAIQEDLKALHRRKLIKILNIDGRIFCKIADPLLLTIFVDYEDAQEKGEAFAPYRISPAQKKILLALTRCKKDFATDKVNWLKFFNDCGAGANIGDWMNIVQMKWMKEESAEMYAVNPSMIEYMLKALHYEDNIRGVL